MNLYLIWLEGDRQWDTYSGAVVAAKNVHDARRTHPDGRTGWESSVAQDTWVDKRYVREVKVKLLGTADPKVEPGVVLANFDRG